MEKLHSLLREKHKSETAVRGISLSEELRAHHAENFDAAQWIKKSRELERSQKQKEKQNELFEQRKAALYREEEHMTSSLKGKVVDHPTTSFKKGESKILILKDRRILDKALNIDAAEDELINVALHEEEQRARRRRECADNGYDPLSQEALHTLLPQYEQRDTSRNRDVFHQLVTF